MKILSDKEFYAETLNERDFLAQIKRALERVTRKRLCSGVLADKHGNPCAVGAWMASFVKEGVPPNATAMRKAMDAAPYQHKYYEVMSESDNAIDRKNDAASQRARWKHVYNYVTARLEDLS